MLGAMMDAGAWHSPTGGEEAGPEASPSASAQAEPSSYSALARVPQAVKSQQRVKHHVPVSTCPTAAKT
eukprot:741921-Alexandrium_andersonii.AAC.1